MHLLSGRWIGTVVFTALLVGLIAVATGEALTYHLAVMLAAIAAAVGFFFVVFPGSGFFAVAFANFLAIYACIFIILKESNFAAASGWPVSAGFLLPIMAFLAGTWLRRRHIQGLVTAQRVREEQRFLRFIVWLLPVSAVGVASFTIPTFDLTGPQVGLALLGAMGLIALVVFGVSREVCVFLIDTGLLFESFFARVGQIVIPAFAFFTFYSLLVIVFATLYRIVDMFAAAPQFVIDGVRRTITFPESLYFSIVTVSTVGYGDILPAGGPVRFVAAVQILSGVLLLLFGFSEIIGYSRDRRGR